MSFRPGVCKRSTVVSNKVRQAEKNFTWITNDWCIIILREKYRCYVYPIAQMTMQSIRAMVQWFYKNNPIAFQIFLYFVMSEHVHSINAPFDRDISFLCTSFHVASPFHSPFAYSTSGKEAIFKMAQIPNWFLDLRLILTKPLSPHFSPHEFLTKKYGSCVS